MANVASWVEQLAQDVRLTFPDADVYEGERSGKATDRAKVAVFWSGDSEQGDQVVVAEARVFVRYWPASPKIRDDAPGGVRSPTELTTARTTLQALLQAKQKAYPDTGVWYSRLVRCTPDYDAEEWGVEGELVLVFDNPAVIA